MQLDQVRQLALALPETGEEPHHHFSSFRVRGKIFITVPPEQSHIHLFVPPDERETIAEQYPALAEKLWWGKKVVGLRIRLGEDSRHDTLLAELIDSAWRAKAPAALLKQRQR